MIFYDEALRQLNELLKEARPGPKKVKGRKWEEFKEAKAAELGIGRSVDRE